MRTTLVLDDELARKAKERAAALNTTVSEIVNRALRDSFSKPVEDAPPFEMVTFGNPANPIHHEPADFANVMDEEDGLAFGGRDLP